jgi:hypothetical protein
VATDLSATPACVTAATGACCNGQTCTIKTQLECLNQSGWYWGDNTTCTVNPCLAYDSSCLIISEVVNGAESGECPRYVEITNAGSSRFLFVHGGLIIQTGASVDTTVDVDLTGVVIDAGHALVISSNQAGACSGAFQGVYGFRPEFSTNVLFGSGTDRYILTDTADGSHLVDIYGEFGIDGNSQPWEYTLGYAHRLSAYNTGNGSHFVDGEWFLGGRGSSPGGALPSVTSPSLHVLDHVCTGVTGRGDLNCSGAVDIADLSHFVQALVDPAGYNADHDGTPYPVCGLLRADMNNDQVVDGLDIAMFADYLVNN